MARKLVWISSLIFIALWLILSREDTASLRALPKGPQTPEEQIQAIREILKTSLASRAWDKALFTLKVLASLNALEPQDKYLKLKVEQHVQIARLFEELELLIDWKIRDTAQMRIEALKSMPLDAIEKQHLELLEAQWKHLRPQRLEVPF